MWGCEDKKVPVTSLDFLRIRKLLDLFVRILLPPYSLPIVAPVQFVEADFSLTDVSFFQPSVSHCTDKSNLNLKGFARPFIQVSKYQW